MGVRNWKTDWSKMGRAMKMKESKLLKNLCWVGKKISD